MHTFATVLVAGLALLESSAALSIPRDAKYVVHEKREDHHAGVNLAKRSQIGSGSLLPIRIGLTQPGLEHGYDLVMDVAHPDSKNYGKHYSAEEVNRLFAPTAETVQAVRNWLIDSGIAEHRIKVSDNKGWLAFDAEIHEAEELFRTQYFQQEHSKHANKYSVGCDQ